MADVSVHASCEPTRSHDSRAVEPLTFRSIDTHVQAQPGSLEFSLARLIFAARGLANSRIKISQTPFGSLPAEPLVYCDECQMASLRGKLTHAPSCRTGSVLEILAGICQLGDTHSTPSPNRRKEDAPAAESTRMEDGKLSCAEFGEPWEVEAWTNHAEDCVMGSDGRHMVSAAACRNPAERELIADRIAACVNFCAGIPTAILEDELPLASPKRRRLNEVQFLPRALPWLTKLPVLPTEADDSAVLR